MKRKITNTEQGPEKKPKIDTDSSYLSATTLTNRFEQSLLRVCALAESFRIFEVCFVTNNNKNNPSLLVSLIEQVLSKNTFDLPTILAALGNKIEVTHKHMTLEQQLKMTEEKCSITTDQLKKAHEIMMSACEYFKEHHPGLLEKYFNRQLLFYRGQSEFKLPDNKSDFQNELIVLLSNYQPLLCKSPIESAKIIEFLFQTKNNVDELADSLSLALFVGRDMTLVNSNKKRELIPNLKPHVQHIFMQLSHKFFEFKYHQFAQQQLVEQANRPQSNSHSNSNSSPPAPAAPKTESIFPPPSRLPSASPASSSGLSMGNSSRDSEQNRLIAASQALIAMQSSRPQAMEISPSVAQQTTFIAPPSRAPLAPPAPSSSNGLAGIPAPILFYHQQLALRQQAQMAEAARARLSQEQPKSNTKGKK